MKDKLATALATAVFLTLVGHLAAQQIIRNRIAIAGSLPATHLTPIQMAGSPNGTFAYEGISASGEQALFVRLPGASWVKLGVVADFDPNGGVFQGSYPTPFSLFTLGELHLTDGAIFLTTKIGRAHV